jgi:redox-sensitive bicupin YhaK (pirin superfamily)
MSDTARPVTQKIPAPAVRSVDRKFEGTPTLEGAGVRLRRMFGNSEVPLLDPFLLLDNFGSANPADYLAGFPWHPHRGIETVTYMLNGTTAHEDSLGNKGAIDSGDVQWMSSGSGILHQEMPKRTEGRLAGYQLWVNLPRRLKMEDPSYRGLRASAIPIAHEPDGTRVRTIAGTFRGVEGPVQGIPVDPTYLDITMPAAAELRLPVRRGYTAFAQVIDGSASFDPAASSATASAGAPRDDAPGAKGTRPSHGTAGETIVYGDGDHVEIRAGPEGSRFLLVSGRPLQEPVAWYGPIVMNTREEILEAARELRNGTFIRTTHVINEV